ncbi:MAG: undecaprenyl/decaprenyl-phosphate alpha-N-acetylglucosaminyl 1-phosphate transferase [Anaerolineales bacterium]|uniref:glycosyltransferase family 4 protein n=1 Tax=Candidatus Villigracilis proximus TaxID=3140683 RepID=UPI003136D884|nr:undecaprenyl/decaprenyl-phosphate alpha-N-acetylglucosaminyl 1-phosphate transferase [Anaerolineales bacterium]
MSVIAAPISISLAWRFKLIDRPGSEAHKIHSQPMPRAGGFIIFFVIIAGSALSGIITSNLIVPVISASVIILAFGIWDDINGIIAPWKMLGQLLAALLLIWQGVMVHFTGVYAFDILITIFWVVGITNAYNLVDSMDGLAAGLGVITSLFLMIGTFQAGQESLAIFGAILLGCSIGVFYFNFHCRVYFWATQALNCLVLRSHLWHWRTLRRIFRKPHPGLCRSCFSAFPSLIPRW